MTKLNNKFAIGCLVQWYEVEIVEEYLTSVAKAVENIENKKNIIVDVMVNLGQNLEEVDRKQKELGEIFQKFLKISRDLSKHKMMVRMNFYPASINEAATNKEIKPYTIADYRREFNDKYCEEVDVLMWGETDSLIPTQTFEILDNLHSEVKESKRSTARVKSFCMIALPIR